MNGHVETIPVGEKNRLLRGKEKRKQRNAMLWKPIENNVSRTECSSASDILRIQIR